jgi:hypothetical protein
MESRSSKRYQMESFAESDGTSDWEAIMKQLSPKKNWENTMSKIIIAKWNVWLAMWGQQNGSIDSKTRYCTLIQDDINRLNLYLIYGFRHMLSNSI